ncbi:MAG: hypothetical protein MJZ74_10890 [Muribaculaceae bacterium]|nr:hypothetical protein [Muribaculaceae bacterium]
MKARLFTLLVLIMSMTMNPAFTAQSKGKSSKTIYYVVVGSFTDYNKAVFFANNAPCDVEHGNVYKTTVNGKTYYRVCDSCYYSKARAQKRAREIKNDTSFETIDAWVWANQGLAKCVCQVMGSDGTYWSTRPE